MLVATGALAANWSAGAADVQPQAGTVDEATKATFQDLAEAILTDRTSALVDQKQGKQRTSRFHGDVRLSSKQARQESSDLSALRGRKSRLAKLGEEYKDADTQVSVDKARVKGDRATVEVTETTTLTYKKVRGNEPKTTGFQAHHELTFKSDSHGDWQLSGIRSTDQGYAAVNQPDTEAVATTADDEGTPEATRSAITTNPAAKAKNFTASGLDYKAMATYAEKYWSNYNSAYRNFNSVGGDCTNFVSQSLKAGGWANVSGSASDYKKWWYDASSTQSDSWVGVNEFSWFALSSKRATSLANVYQMDVGDVLQMDFDKDGSKDHTMITTYRSSSGVPYLTYHATNTYRRSVASIIASYPNSYYYAYRT
ncbi:amidase domain-containing protein [Streptomyces sp. NPDC059785]|uniref:amidase domain-containing protein n=1 Tax=Streptomyces sp. NPDC059785 TaxID=3346945 RepID=UPI00364DCBB5